MNIIEQTSIVNTTKSLNRKIKYIVIHYTAGITSESGTAKKTAKYFAKEAAKASADFIVDDEFVVQFNPDIKNRYCWHAGGSKYKTKGGSLYKVATSANSIGIEICSTNDTGKVTQANDIHYLFKDKSIKNTIELVKYLMSEYNIDADHVIRHYDINGKPCPGIIGWNADTGDESKWLDFKAELIKKEIIEDTNPIAISDKTETTESKQTITVGDVIDIIESADQEPITEIQNKLDIINKPEQQNNLETINISKEKTTQKTSIQKQKSSNIIDIIFNILKTIFNSK